MAPRRQPVLIREKSARLVDASNHDVSRGEGPCRSSAAVTGKAQAVADKVAAMPGVSVQAHWEIGSQTEIDGSDFYIGEEELGHIHLDGEAHIPIGTKLARKLIRAGLAEEFPWGTDFVVADTKQVALVTWLFELRHAQIAGVTEADLLAQIAAR